MGLATMNTAILRRNIRKRNNERFGHRIEYTQPNKNGHSPAELLEWYYLAIAENRPECAAEWKSYLAEWL